MCTCWNKHKFTINEIITGTMPTSFYWGYLHKNGIMHVKISYISKDICITNCDLCYAREEMIQGNDNIKWLVSDHFLATSHSKAMDILEEFINHWQRRNFIAYSIHNRILSIIEEV